MIAASDAAKGAGPPPHELQMAWRIERWGDPWGGGWMDWPAGMIDKITAAQNVYNAQKAYQSAASAGNTADWTKNNATAWKIVSDIMALRRKLKGKAK